MNNIYIYAIYHAHLAPDIQEFFDTASTPYCEERGRRFEVRLSSRVEIPDFDESLSDEQLSAELRRINSLWDARQKRVFEIREEMWQLQRASRFRRNELERRSKITKGKEV